MSYAVPSVDGRHRAERDAVTASEGTPAVRTLHVVPAPRRSPGRRLGSLLVNVLVLLSVVLFLLIALGPHLFGYRTSTMLTGSMSPGINPGDVVVTVPRPAADVQVGDVISYHIPVEDHRVETHRVTKVIHGKDGSIAIRTKGDANSTVDPWKATLVGDTVWESKVVIPELGSAIHFLRQPAFRNGVFWLAFLGLVLVGLIRIWARPQTVTEPAPAMAVTAEDEAAARERAARRATAAARAAAGAMADAATDRTPRRTARPAAAAVAAAHAATVSTSAAADEQGRSGTRDEKSKGAQSA